MSRSGRVGGYVRWVYGRVDRKVFVWVGACVCGWLGVNVDGLVSVWVGVWVGGGGCDGAWVMGAWA